MLGNSVSKYTKEKVKNLKEETGYSIILVENLVSVSV